MHERAPRLRERRSSAVGASRTVTLTRAFGAAIGAAVFLAASGAFHTGEAPFSVRLIYWLTTMLTTTAVAVLLFMLAELVPGFAERPILRGAALTLGLSPPLTVLVWLLTTTLFRGQSGVGRELVTYAGPVMLVTAAMITINTLAAPRNIETHAAAPGASAPRFLSRLPPRLRGGDLHAVQAEDHYLRLHTSKGSDLILMRLSDAIAELEGLEGARTHRSWWIAKDAVIEVRRADGRATLTLKGGIEAPVSRGYVAVLRDAGWF